MQIIPFILAELFAVRRLVKKKINVIHAHWCIPQGFVAVAYKLLFFSKVKIICTSHGADIYGLRKYDFIKRWVLNRCDRITAVSNALKAEILALNVKVDVKVIPMGVDLSLFNPNAKSGVLQSRYSINGPLLLYVGRLSDKKGVKYLISAMTKIVRSVPSTKLLIVGDGEELESLSDLSSDLGLSNEIVFAGAVKIVIYQATMLTQTYLLVLQLFQMTVIQKALGWCLLNLLVADVIRLQPIYQQLLIL
ncbi:glycosyltransferase [Candidatus Reidiella endopervernicosa]|uniref:Glycosyltransferase n=1 Tax=Candidatus Reidiella endopervernicosa TaxID=2738883 RepID=A0A6N0HVH6_9GAMM|nr:glycosyltransferase [Candidatus Reidiella endopervernicosa]